MLWNIKLSKACYICFDCISLIMEECVVLSLYLPNTPKLSNEKLNGQYLGREKIGRAGGQREEVGRRRSRR